MLYMVQGLITKERKNLDPSAAPFARHPEETDGLKEGANIVEVVNAMLFVLSKLLSIA